LKNTVSKNDIELLLWELWEYWKTLWTVEQVSTDIFNILNLAKNSNWANIDHKVWVNNLQNTERFPWCEKVISDNVFAHQVRLSEIVDELMFFIEEIVNEWNFNSKIDGWYVYWLALVHDDSEWISPLKDIPTTIKLWLSEQSNKILSILEDSFIDILSRFHEDNLKYGMTSDKLKELYLDSENKNSLSWQMVSYLDKVDWFMSCLHEIYNWNEWFKKQFKNYIKILTEIRDNKEKYPKIRFILDWDINKFQNKINNLPWFDSSNDYDYDKSVIKKTWNRSSNVLELFNINWLLDIEKYLDKIIDTWIIDKSYEYQILAWADWLHPDFEPNVETTIFKSYEAWKIAYAKMCYIDVNWNKINWYDAMYWKCEIPFKFNKK